MMDGFLCRENLSVSLLGIVKIYTRETMFVLYSCAKRVQRHAAFFPNLFSLPSIRRFILDLCLYMHKSPIIVQKIENASILKKINDEMIAPTDAQIEDRETYLEIAQITINTPSAISAVGQWSAISTAKLVATPFPPLNL